MVRPLLSNAGEVSENTRSRFCNSVIGRRPVFTGPAAGRRSGFTSGPQGFRLNAGTPERLVSGASDLLHLEFARRLTTIHGQLSRRPVSSVADARVRVAPHM